MNHPRGAIKGTVLRLGPEPRWCQGRRDTDGETWAAEAQRKERSPFLSWEREVFLKKSFTPLTPPPNPGNHQRVPRICEFSF